MITLYTTNCPKCKVLEKKLNDKNIDFVTNSNVDEMVSLGYLSAPILKVDNTIMDFAVANQWINEQ